MASKRKVSVTLDESVIREIREQAGDGHLSEWLNETARLRLQGTMLAKIMTDHGVILSPELLAEVDAEWPRTRVV